MPPLLCHRSPYGNGADRMLPFFLGLVKFVPGDNQHELNGFTPKTMKITDIVDLRERSPLRGPSRGTAGNYRVFGILQPET
jgi:hypothetical protein